MSDSKFFDFRLKLLMLTCMALTIVTTPLSAKSLALVIGNDEYTDVEDLQKAREDATGYQDYLQRQGFDVSMRTDLNSRDMSFELATFYDQIAPGDTVAFIYSGHGWSNGRENFLLPTDIRPEGSETLIAQDSFVLRNGANGILDQIASRNPRLTIAIVDACRNNPFSTPSGTRSVGLTRGLVPVTAPAGTFVAFSAGASQTALDRLSDGDSESYSVFTRHFLEQLDRHPDLQSAFKATQLAVNAAASQIGHPQLPAYYDEVIGQACLSGSCEPIRALPKAEADPVFVVAEKPDATRIAAEEWDDFKETSSIEALRLFAERHDGTAFAPLARERIRKLELASVKADVEIASVGVPKEVDTKRAVEVVEEPAPKVETVASADVGTQVAAATLPPIAKEADNRPVIMEIQKRLNWLGCGAGSPDGDLGPRSRRALALFARAANRRVSSNPAQLKSTLAALRGEQRRVCSAQWLAAKAPQLLSGRWSYTFTCGRNKKQQVSGRLEGKVTARNQIEGAIWANNGAKGRFVSQIHGNLMSTKIWWNGGRQSTLRTHPSKDSMAFNGSNTAGCSVRIWK